MNKITPKFFHLLFTLLFALLGGTINAQRSCDNSAQTATSMSKITSGFFHIFFTLLVSSAIFAQDNFETDFSGWTNVNGDQAQWTRLSGATPSDNTGPSTASSRDFYIYLETSNPVNIGDRAWLQKQYDLTGQVSSQLLFDYHMFGSAMGTLNVQVSNNGGSSFATIFTRVGDQGNSWFNSLLDISAYDGQNIIIRFE